MPTARPPGDGKIFDALHQRFGIGDHDPHADGALPFHQWKMKEVTKIKATRTKRGVSVEDLLLTVEYCGAMGIWIFFHYELYDHVLDAIRWDKARREVDRHAVADQKITEAIAIEAENPDSYWLERFLRASGDGREEVYVEWLGRPR